MNLRHKNRKPETQPYNYHSHYHNPNMQKPYLEVLDHLPRLNIQALDPQKPNLGEKSSLTLKLRRGEKHIKLIQSLTPNFICVGI